MTRYHSPMNPPTTRFAPSPSGFLHLGNVRTALFSLLAALPAGRFLVRIEDTDQDRSGAQFEAALLADLAWLGFGPYFEKEAVWRQSERTAIYDDYLDRLRHEDLIYPCFCSETELAQERAAMRARQEPPRYAGRCAALAPAHAEARLAAGEPAVWRFRVPAADEVVFTDLVRGPQRIQTRLIGDFVVRRANGAAVFFFANALDDALAGVTVVLRGEDHLSNTARQILLLRALGLAPPQYGHLPLVLNESGTPLSKRDGAGSLAALREEGFLPLAIVNYLARLGATVDSDALLSIPELAQVFDYHRIGHAPAHFDREQLRHWQRLAMAQAPLTSLRPWAGARVPAVDIDRFLAAARPNALFPADLARWADILYGPDPALDGPAQAAVAEAGHEFFARAAAFLAAGGEAPELPAALKGAGYGGRRLFHGLRAGLTGCLSGPELKDILSLMPRALVVRRLMRFGANDA